MASFAALNTPQDMVIALVTRTIVDALHPRRIVLVGSRARGDARPDSDYDVVLEFDADAKEAVRLAHEAYGLFAPGQGWDLNVIPRVTGEIERRADDPGTIDWDIAREGRVLYSADGLSTTESLRRTARVRETPPSNVPESVAEWIKLAESDRSVARDLASAGAHWTHVCFHSQQCAEKYLKALLVSRWVRPPRIHRMEDLLSALRASGEQLPGLDGRCKTLTPYAVAARYGLYTTHDEAEARAAFQAAEGIRAAVLPLLGRGESK